MELGDPEAISILEMIESALKAADWVQRDWTNISKGSMLVGRSGLPTIGGNVAITGVLILIDGDSKSALRAAGALVPALNAEGISVSAALSIGEKSANDAVIHIQVGRKI